MASKRSRRRRTLVRPAWMFQVTTACQRAVCRMALANGSLDECERLVDALPAPRTRVEELLVYGVAFELALRARGLSPATSPRGAARRGVHMLLADEIGRERRKRSTVLQIAQRMIDTASGRLDLHRLASDAGCHVTTVRRDFRRTFGMSMRQYQTRVRVWKAIGLFADGTRDVIAVARTAGYRSEKNFYRAVRSITGLTPAQLRDRSLRRDCSRCQPLGAPSCEALEASRPAERAPWCPARPRTNPVSRG